ncbi:MAG: SHOCT domain-containing protein [Chloroflexales bacterium]|nr:SHOCT domain-containing protein [Chloroflexales bacterium]
MRRGARGATRSGPGLLGTIGRTAVVAGTATAVSKGVSGAMDSAAQQKAIAEQQKAIAEQQKLDDAVQQALAQQQAAQPPAAAPAAPAAGADRIAQLQQLAELKSLGVLTDEEFAAEKARILAS